MSTYGLGLFCVGWAGVNESPAEPEAVVLHPDQGGGERVQTRGGLLR